MVPCSLCNAAEGEPCACAQHSFCGACRANFVKADGLCPLRFVAAGAALLDVVACPVCLETPTGRWYQCERGHVLCAACWGKVHPRRCPVCRVSVHGAPIRCLAMEALARAREEAVATTGDRQIRAAKVVPVQNDVRRPCKHGCGALIGQGAAPDGSTHECPAVNGRLLRLRFASGSVYFAGVAGREIPYFPTEWALFPFRQGGTLTEGPPGFGALLEEIYADRRAMICGDLRVVTWDQPQRQGRSLFLEECYTVARPRRVWRAFPRRHGLLLRRARGGPDPLLQASAPFGRSHSVPRPKRRTPAGRLRCAARSGRRRSPLRPTDGASWRLLLSQSNNVISALFALGFLRRLAAVVP